MNIQRIYKDIYKNVDFDEFKNLSESHKIVYLKRVIKSVPKFSKDEAYFCKAIIDRIDYDNSSKTVFKIIKNNI